jgi:glycosyltransferase involved in cell wall biosynthesis
LFERNSLAHAAAIHVTSESERDSVRNLFPNVSVVGIPNGVDLPPAPQVARRSATVAFLGRIHHKKGLDILVRAMKLLKVGMPGVHLLIAGEMAGTEVDRLKRLSEAEGVERDVSWVGPVYGRAKDEFLASASVLCLPSRSENFGMVVLEAMAAGTPVVVSRNCPWSEVEREGAGCWVENTPADIATALAHVLADPIRASAMGLAGRRIAETYSWTRIGRDMAAAYEGLSRQPSVAL